MSLLISLFSCSIDGSLGSVDLIVFLSVILFEICSGSGMWCELIFPLGM